MIETLITVISGLVLSMWGLNLWEIRQLRKDNRELRAAIAGLTSAITELRSEMGHKASDVELSVVEHQLDRKVDK